MDHYTKKQHHIILTSGPGSGKSSLINELKNRNYSCFIEAGRAIIQDQCHIVGNTLPWVAPNTFAELILN
ncbi:AAA family ATPase [Proteus hauseri]|uniref:AAA family ATPase n=1 Tax=Proteus hauseri TaxID=183417 RepID=UPI001FC9A34B|nr:AAA family ATPase [Proteus hauseri]